MDLVTGHEMVLVSKKGVWLSAQIEGGEEIGRGLKQNNMTASFLRVEK